MFRMVVFGFDVAAWASANVGRVVFLLVVLVAAWLMARVLSRMVRSALDRTGIPNVSIFVNLTKVLVWVLAVAVVLQPVFGVSPSTVVAALGVSGIAVSLGLKDTIANVVGGFGLMAGRVIHPGDLVSVNGRGGRVADVTWRHTTIVERGGSRLVIPNSVLNTTVLERLTDVDESLASLPFTVHPGVDVVAAEGRILDAVRTATEGVREDGSRPLVRFTGCSPFGVTGVVYLHARPGEYTSIVVDAAVRAMSTLDCVTFPPMDGAGAMVAVGLAGGDRPDAGAAGAPGVMR